jgi:hypothetical protein
MVNPHLEFAWSVNARGYHWVQAAVASEPSKPPQPALVATEPTDGGWTPAKPDPALFRTFAELRPDKECVAAFAHCHGDLTDGFELLAADRADKPGGGHLRGTLLVTWQYQIADMRRLTELWDILQRQERQRLEPHILWRKSKGKGLTVQFDSHPGGGKGDGPSLGLHRAKVEIASSKEDPELFATFQVGDPLLPAWVYLQQDLDLHLYHVAAELASEMVWDSHRNRPTLRLAAPTLLSAVWLQFGDAVSNNRTFSSCPTCGRWFVVAPDVARAHRRFCSNACRVKAHRERQDRARQLFAAGQTFEEIAAELDSDVGTVKRWITGQKQ